MSRKPRRHVWMIEIWVRGSWELFTSQGFTYRRIARNRIKVAAVSYTSSTRFRAVKYTPQEAA